MAGRSSVTRGEASPAPSILDSTPRRSSSRASRKATRELELSTSHPSRLAYSLPPTPITSSFEEALSSTQRAKRHRSVNYYEKTPQSKGAETPNQKNTSFSAQPSGSVSRKSSRSRRSENTDNDTAKERDSTGDQVVTPSTSTSNPKRKSQIEQSTLHTYLQKKPQDRRRTLTTQPEAPDKSSPKPDPKPDATSTAMGAAVSSGRQTRKSVPDKLNGAESVDKTTPKSKLVTRLSTPVSRKDRKSTSAVQIEQVPKSTPQIKPESTPTANSTSKAAKSPANGNADPATPDERTPVSTPNSTTTRSRRRDRKSARKSTAGRSQLANESSEADTAVNTDAEDRKPVIQGSDKGSSEPQQASKRPSNTVTLSLGRKSLESFVQKTLEPAACGNEIADSVEGTPVHVYDDSYHFDYDADMYRNNFGLDGQIDTPASPTSFSTTTSTGARVSGRTRKPTIRALESLESERRFRRPRAQTPGKADSSAAGRQSDNAPSGSKIAQQSKTALAEATQVPSATPPLDVDAFARRIFELAAAAVSDDFVPAPEADTWLEELQKEYRGKGSTEVTAVAAVVEGESRQPSDDKPPTEQWTDEDGWTHTGQINEFGEEYVVFGPDFEWYRPNNTYGDKQLPEPPVRLRSLEQSEKDRIFGFPPRIGERNLPRATNFPFMMEDVYHERVKIKAREEARHRGIAVDRSMSVSQIEALIDRHSKSGSSSQSSETPAPAKGSKPDRPTGSRKRRRTEPAIPSEAASTNESTTESTQKPKRRRKNTVGPPAPTPAAPEPSSEKPKTLKLKLIFSKRELPATPSTSTTTNTSAKSKKRPRSEIETDGDNAAGNGPAKSPKITPSHPTTTPRRLLTLSTPKQGQKEKSDAAPTSTPEVPPSADQSSLTTPGGRPRRRAAAALMAEFQNHKEERARRANARKKTNTDNPQDEPNPGLTPGSSTKQP